MPKHAIRDVIVLLPGITGSVLARDGKEVWAPRPGAAWRALLSLGRSIKELRLTEDPLDQDVLADGVTATGLVQTLHIVPGVWAIDGYTGVRKMILDNFDVVPGRTYVEFAYDWRRDNRVAARQLAARAERVLAEARKTQPDAKLVLVGHSMGGLVARYYVECLGGWKDTRRLITFGTPYRGSVNSLDFLANGFVKKVGPLKVADLTDLLRSFTSIYQLLPIYRCVDEGGAEPVRPAESSHVPRLDVGRARTALEDFHRAIEKAVGTRPADAYEIHPVVGITQPTWQSARVAGGRLEVLRTRRNSAGEDVDESGDGTVPRVSATPIELHDPRPVFASQLHASLQNTESVLTQLLGVLTEVEDLEQIKDARAGIELAMEDVFVAGEPIALRASTQQPRLELQATVTDLATGVSEPPVPLVPAGGDGGFSAELPPREPGDYGVTVSAAGLGERLVQPVTGVFACTPAEPEDVD